MRLVPNQNWEKIGQLVADALKARAPKSVKVEVKLLHGGSAYGADLASDAYKAAEQAYMDVYGKLPIPTRSGGSIPIIATFEQVLGIKSLLMGFGLEADAIHSPNESYLLQNFFRGIETIATFYQHYGK